MGEYVVLAEPALPMNSPFKVAAKSGWECATAVEHIM